MIRREPFFLQTPGGARFGIATRPPEPATGGLLFVHPFAEEMNKSRRMVALAADRFAASGWMVLQLDLGGCGDSAGDFGDFDWTAWLDDVSHAWDWLQSRCDGPAVVWCLRAGCLLVSDWLERERVSPPLMIWQPVANGRQHLSQFLRLKAVSEMLSAADARAVVSGLRAELEAGRPVEVAGYRISPGMAAGLGAAALQLPETYGATALVAEAVPTGQTEPSPAMASLAEKLEISGARVSVHAVHGPPFWQTQEIETAPAFIEPSLRMLRQVST